MTGIPSQSGWEYKLKLWQILLWVFASALMPAIYRTSELWNHGGYPADLIRRLSVLDVTLVTLQSPLWGAAIAATLIGLWHLRNGRKFPVHPGHILLVIQCASLAVGLACHLIQDFVVHSGNAATDYRVVSIGFYLFTAVANGVAARFSSAKHWRIGFLGLAAFETFMAAFFVVQLVDNWRSAITHRFIWIDESMMVGQTILVLCLITYVSICDSRGSFERDWLHWAGVLCQGCGSIVQSVGVVGYTWIQGTYHY